MKKQNKKNKKLLNCEDIGSAGLVQILYKDKYGKYRLKSQHNTGKMPLFTFITSALQGNPLYECAPNSLNAYYHYDTEVRETINGVEQKSYKTVRDKAFVMPLPIISAPIRMISDDTTGLIDSDRSDIIQYSFLLPTTNIIKKDDKSYVDELCLENARSVPSALYVGEEDLKTCASLMLGEGELNPEATSNILIYWKIKFSNISGTN